VPSRRRRACGGRSRGRALAAFDGSDPNGTWSLYVTDGYADDSGWIDGGWCLSIDSADVAGSTATALESSPNPLQPGVFATFTATVTTGGEPVTDGTVTFSDGGTTLGAVDVDANGRAAFETRTLAVGRHSITACYGGGTGLAPSAHTITHTVTTIASDGYGTVCNRDGIAVADYHTAVPYPSPITVQGLGSRVTGLTVELGGFNDGYPSDLQVMLVGPDGQNLVLMSDTGGSDGVTGGRPHV
jgi:Bacterial Ig-like domain (group 3)